VVVLQNKDKS